MAKDATSDSEQQHKPKSKVREWYSPAVRHIHIAQSPPARPVLVLISRANSPGHHAGVARDCFRDGQLHPRTSFHRLAIAGSNLWIHILESSGIRLGGSSDVMMTCGSDLREEVAQSSRHATSFRTINTRETVIASCSRGASVPSVGRALHVEESDPWQPAIV